jgi:hypothetical protein
LDAIPTNIESIKVIDNTQYHGLKAYDENNNEIDIRIDNRGEIRNSPHQQKQEQEPGFHINLWCRI